MPNGFDGMWSPYCPTCGGYMHTGHTDDCAVTVRRNRENARLLELLRASRAVGEGAQTRNDSEPGVVRGGGQG